MVDTRGGVRRDIADAEAERKGAGRGRRGGCSERGGEWGVCRVCEVRWRESKGQTGDAEGWGDGDEQSSDDHGQ